MDREAQNISLPNGNAKESTASSLEIEGLGGGKFSLGAGPKGGNVYPTDAQEVSFLLSFFLFFF
jgi:hypothetical protein